MRLLVSTIALVLSAPAYAENVRDISPFTQALFSNMALNWVCRDVIGIAHYQAARTIAVEGLAKYVGRNNAVLHVDELNEKFRHDPRRYETTPAKCFELKSEAMHKISVEKAKLEAE